MTSSGLQLSMEDDPLKVNKWDTAAVKNGLDDTVKKVGQWMFVSSVRSRESSGAFWLTRFDVCPFTQTPQSRAGFTLTS